MLHIRAVKHVSDYTIWVSFDDGTDGVADLQSALSGPIFEPLKRIDLFSRVAVDPESETIVWPNGADLAPEYVKSLVCQQRAAPV